MGRPDLTTRPHIDALTGIRGIAAWLVVLYHIRTAFVPSLPGGIIDVLAKGYLAVDLFFVLSGFVLWMTWGQRLAVEQWRAVPGFLNKRIARVWPLHAFILTATVALALVMMASGRTPVDHDHWNELPLHYLLIQNWGFTSQLAWNHPSWSISTELAAYLGFALFVPLIGQAIRRMSVTAKVLGALATSIAMIVLLDQFFMLHGETTLGPNIPYFGLARCLTQFICGVAMCIVWQTAHGPLLRISTAAVFMLSIALWMGGVAREVLTIPVAFAALVPLIASTSALPHNPLASRIAVFLGEISYSTYLSHFLLWSVFKLMFVRDAANVSLLLGAIFLVATLVASVFLYRFVEVPARRRFGEYAVRKPVTA